MEKMEKKETEIIHCTCGNSSQIPVHGTVGYWIEMSGFHPIMTYLGPFVWLCPDCYRIIHANAKNIMRIVKDDHIYFPDLLRDLDEVDVK